MRILVILACYFAVALALLSAGVVGASILSGLSTSSQNDPPRLVRKADRKAGEQQFNDTPRSGQAFRYGPEVNHGRGDTPVNYSQQALKEARSAAPEIQSPQPYQQFYQARRIDNAVRPSGH